MKKVFLLIAVLIVAIGLQAQDFRSVLQPEVTYRMNDVSVLVTDTSSYDVYWDIQSHTPYRYSLAMDIDSVLGVSGKDTLYVYGKIGPEDAWTALGKVAGTSNSQTLRFNSVSAASYYRYLRALYSKIDTSSVRVDYHWLKIWKE